MAVPQIPGSHNKTLDLRSWLGVIKEQTGCPAWGAEFCLHTAWGAAVYLERVATVQEIEVLSTELLGHGPYIAAIWQEHWSCSGLVSESQLRLICKQGMLSLNAEYIAQAHCATARLHTWGGGLQA